MTECILTNAGVYSITNTSNGKKYIGSSVNVTQRIRQHKSLLRGGKHTSIKLQNSYKKHGEKSFNFEIIEFVSRFQDLVLREQFYIEKYKSLSNGYNVRQFASSNYGLKHSEETKLKISNYFKGRPKGYSSTKGKKLSQEHKDKLLKIHLGAKRSLDTKLKISNSAKGHKRWLGKKHTDLSKLLVSEANSKKVIIDNIVYDSFTKASKALNCHKSTISIMVKKGRAKLLETNR